MARSTRLLLLAGTLLAAAACQDARNPVAPAARDAARSSAPLATMGATGVALSHRTQSTGFHFLPPLAPPEAYAGPQDRTLQPEVRICELSGDACVRTVADFSQTTATNFLKVYSTPGFFWTVWDTHYCVTGRCRLDPAKQYRMEVLVGPRVLGSVDLTLVTRAARDGSHRHCDCDDRGGDRWWGGDNVEHSCRGDGDDHDHHSIRLVLGSLLPIAFRIDRNVPAAIQISPAPSTVPVGTPVPLTPVVTDLHGGTIAAPVTWTSSDPTIATVDQNGLVTTVGTGTVTITASTDGVSTSTTLSVQSAAVPGCLAPPAGIVSWWTGDGNANDFLGRNNANASPTLAYGTGMVGQAFALNGVDAYASIPYNPSLDFAPTGQFTIEGWVKPAEQNSFEGIFVKSPPDSHWDYGLYLNPNNSYQVFVYPYDPNSFMSGYNQVHVVSSVTTTSIGSWYHVAVTYDNGSWAMYVNGVLENTRSGEFITQSTGGLAIGKKGEASYDPFHGLVDELTVYNRALPATDVAAIYAAGSAGKCKV